jgi:hypothetical protein
MPKLTSQVDGIGMAESNVQLKPQFVPSPSLV